MFTTTLRGVRAGRMSSSLAPAPPDRWCGLSIEASLGPSTIISMDHHAIAMVSVTGVCLDVLGGLYLAYDLLGGQHGPLRLLTRMATYSIVFGIGYGLGLGFFFGVAS